MIKSRIAGVTLVTPQMAQEWLETYKYDLQRNVRQVKVKQLANAIKAGQFTDNLVQIANLNGKSYLTNGQHTMMAIVEADIPIEIVVATYFVESVDDVAELYYTTDINNKRTLHDMYRTKGLNESLGYTAQELGCFGGALRLAESGFSRHEAQLMSYDDLAEKMYEWKPYCDKYLDIIRGCVLTTAGMMRKPIMAVGLVTTRYASEKNEDFWRVVGNNDNTTQGDPRRVLHYFLMQTKIVGGGMEYVVSRSVVKCWNAYFSGKQMQYIRASATGSSIKLLGTDLSV